MSKNFFLLPQTHWRKGGLGHQAALTPPGPALFPAEKNVQVVNRLGLHARPAVDLVRCAQQFQSHIQLRVRGQLYSARRVIDVLLARLNYGTEFTIVADGPDAAFAVEALAALITGLQETDAHQDESVRTNRLQRFDLEDS